MHSHESDYTLVGIIGVIVLLGLVFLSSASAPLAYSQHGDAYFFVKNQILKGLLPGLVLFFFFCRFDYQKLKKLAFPFLIGTIVLLLLVFIPGIGSQSGTFARSWINIGGFSIQPSEIVKLTFLIYLAAWLEKRNEKKVKDIRYGLLPFLALLGTVAVLIVLQPDIGTLSIIIVTSIVVYFVGGGKISHLFGLGVVGVLGAFGAIKFSQHIRERFTVFLHPEIDPAGIGYHLKQAILAVGSGGFFGLGLGHSRQKFLYLPEVAGDSIFPVIAEEVGFFFSVLFIILFLALAWRGIKLAQETPDRFGRLLVVGIVVWIIFQFFINIGGMIGIMPMTGVPLPFVSYGGTAMMILLAAAGVMVNISKSQIQNHKLQK